MKKVGTFCWRKNEGAREGKVSDRTFLDSAPAKSHSVPFWFKFSCTSHKGRNWKARPKSVNLFCKIIVDIEKSSL